MKKNGNGRSGEEGDNFRELRGEIEQASRWVRERKGRIAALVREYNRRLPRGAVPHTRQQVCEWIDLDPKRRVEPRLTAGLRLITAFRAAKLAEEPEVAA